MLTVAYGALLTLSLLISEDFCSLIFLSDVALCVYIQANVLIMLRLLEKIWPSGKGEKAQTAEQGETARKSGCRFDPYPQRLPIFHLILGVRSKSLLRKLFSLTKGVKVLEIAVGAVFASPGSP